MGTYQKNYYATESGRTKIRSAKFKYQYGITLAERDAQIAAQHNLCKLCGEPLGPDTRTRGRQWNTPVIDHDHMTGKVRGIIHSRCNVGLGNFQDNPDLLRKAVAYLEK